MVNEVNVHDISSAELFQKQWNVYRRIVNNNELSHLNLIDALTKDIHSFRINTSVRVLDLGCGDSYVPFTVFGKNLKDSGVTLASFTGVDASRQALDIAEKTFDNMCSINMIEGDLETFLGNDSSQGQYDIILANFVLHHFSPEVKEKLVGRIYSMLAPAGSFYFGDVYNSEPGSDREQMMLRWRKRFDTFKDITPEELEDVWDHVYGNDFPETIDFMKTSMADVGFKNIDVLFKDDFYACCLRGNKPSHQSSKH